MARAASRAGQLFSVAPGPSLRLMPSSIELMWLLGWVDSYRAILIPGAVSVFGMFLFKQAMGQVPDELLHAGRVDGCSELRLWWEVALPIVRPMVGAFTLMTFIGSWNSFLWPQVVLQDEMKYNLPIGLAKMLMAMRKMKRLRLITLGIKAGYRKRGIDAILYLDTIRTAKRLGYSGGEISWTLEDNDLVNRAIESMGGRKYKTYRVYERDL